MLLALVVVIRRRLVVAGGSVELFVLLFEREERCYSLASAAREAPKHGDGRTVAHLTVQWANDVLYCKEVCVCCSLTRLFDLNVLCFAVYVPSTCLGSNQNN